MLTRVLDALLYQVNEDSGNCGTEEKRLRWSLWVILIVSFWGAGILSYPLILC